MQELTFTTKDTGATFGTNHVFPLLKPMNCPHCDAYQDGTIVTSKLFTFDDRYRWGVVCYRCTHCKKPYLNLFVIDTKDKISNFAMSFPMRQINYSNSLVEEVSPMFIDVYNQALRAEAAGDMALAAMGCRQALECLIKDFAIKELKRPQEEVEKASLFKAIGDYLNEKDLVASADVVRILGNDYVHYKRKYPEHDFILLKSYMNIFIKLVETKLLTAHPPVSR